MCSHWMKRSNGFGFLCEEIEKCYIHASGHELVGSSAYSNDWIFVVVDLYQ